MVVGGGWICIWAFSSVFSVLVVVVVVATMVVVVGERKKEREMVVGFGLEVTSDSGGGDHGDRRCWRWL